MIQGDILYKPILITGCPRSGTYYTYILYKAMGFDIGHEEWGRDGIVSWKACSRNPGQFKNSLLKLTVVRNPVDTINSLATIQKSSQNFMHRVDKRIPRAGSKNRIEKFTRAWVYWTERCLDVTDGFFRVEDLDPDNIIGIPKNTNTREGMDYTPSYGGWSIDQLVETSVGEDLVDYIKFLGYDSDILVE